MLKRLLDIAGSLTGLILLALPLVVVAVLIGMRLGTPILFRQVRPGLNGKPFEMVKFRTMLNATGANGERLPDAERLPQFGRMLRSTSLDELPELWNVLKGDMSLVGPRPLLMDYMTLYSPGQARRHEVRPGITGWAQVNGRNALNWEQKFELDVWYVDNWTIWLDLKIILLTIKRVLARDGITAEGSATAEQFHGQAAAYPESPVGALDVTPADRTDQTTQQLCCPTNSQRQSRTT